jgi:hypothetical protein
MHSFPAPDRVAVGSWPSVMCGVIAAGVNTSLPPDSRQSSPEAASVEFVSVQRNPDAEEPEAPSPENRVEHRDGVVAVVTERPEIGLRDSYIARRPIPSVVPTTGRRRSVPATRGRRPDPVRRGPSGRRPAIPAESALWRRRRRTVVGCTEAVRRIVGAAHLGTTLAVETPRPVWRRRWSTGSRRCRTARSSRSGPTRPRMSTGSTGSRSTRATRATGPRPARPRTTRATRAPRPRRVSDRPVSGSDETRSAVHARLQRRSIGRLDA